MITLVLAFAAGSCGAGHTGLDPLPMSPNGTPRSTLAQSDETAIADTVLAEQILFTAGLLEPDWTFDGMTVEKRSDFAGPNPCVGGPPLANTAAVDADAAYLLDPTGHEAGHMSMEVRVGTTPEKARSDFERVGRNPKYPDCVATDVAEYLEETPGSSVISQSPSTIDLALDLPAGVEGHAVRVISEYSIGDRPPTAVYTDDVDLLLGRLKVNLEFERCCSVGPWRADFERSYVNFAVGRMMAAQRS